MTIVSNSSPIMNLAVVGRLPLLQQLYGQVAVPDAVYHEIVVLGAGQPGSAELQSLTAFSRHRVGDRGLVMALLIELDEGEAEAIALAVELSADLLLMDERLGRRVASRMGLRVVGLLGVLIDAKRNGHSNAVKPALDDLIARAGFWVGPDLYSHVLQTAGE